MGTVHYLQTPKRPKIRKKPVKYYGDLEGIRPKDHPEVARGKRGKPVLAKRQVWVENHNEKLWVVRDLWVNRKGFYPHNVLLAEFGGRSTRVLSESGLRGNMRIWDDVAAQLKDLLERLSHASVHDPESPFKHLGSNAKDAALRFFGRNSKGELIRNEDRPMLGPKVVPKKGSVWKSTRGQIIAVRKHTRRTGEKLWLVIEFERGCAVQEYDGEKWHREFIQIG